MTQFKIEAGIPIPPIFKKSEISIRLENLPAPDESGNSRLIVSLNDTFKDLDALTKKIRNCLITIKKNYPDRDFTMRTIKKENIVEVYRRK